MNQERRKAGRHLRNRELTDRIISVELKAISALEDIHFAIGRSYLKATNLEDGLFLNFATIPLIIKRFCRELPARNATDDVTL